MKFFFCERKSIKKNYIGMHDCIPLHFKHKISTNIYEEREGTLNFESGVWCYYPTNILALLLAINHSNISFAKIAKRKKEFFFFFFMTRFMFHFRVVFVASA